MLERRLTRNYKRKIIMKKQGLPSLVTPENGLEKLLISHVSKVPTDRDLEAEYADRIDRRRVRDRRIVCAVFDAIFEHSTNLDLIKNVETGLDVGKSNKPDSYSEIASVRRHLIHDIDLLDRGEDADALLVPAQIEGPPDGKAISSSRKILILWLVAGELWPTGGTAKYPTRQSLFDEAAKLTNRTAGSFHTYLALMHGKTRFSKAERKLFNDQLKSAKADAKTDGKHTAFALFLPAVQALSVAKIS